MNGLRSQIAQSMLGDGSPATPGLGSSSFKPQPQQPYYGEERAGGYAMQFQPQRQAPQMQSSPALGIGQQPRPDGLPFQPPTNPELSGLPYFPTPQNEMTPPPMDSIKGVSGLPFEMPQVPQPGGMGMQSGNPQLSGLPYFPSPTQQPPIGQMTGMAKPSPQMPGNRFAAGGGLFGFGGR